jgi:type IV pilus assembly protein PilY1
MDYSLNGEKTVAQATTAAGTVLFNTHEPTNDEDPEEIGLCTSALGTARQYAVNFQDGTPTNVFTLPSGEMSSDGRSMEFKGGGYLPTPVPVVVQIDGKYYQTVVAGVQTTNPGGLKLQSRVRTYWYRKVD